MRASGRAGAGVSEHGTPAAGAGFFRRHRGKLLASLLLGGGFVWLLRAGALPLIPPAAALERMRWWTVPAYVALWVGVHTLRAVRWQWLLAPIRRVPLRTLLPVAFVGFAAILLLPLRTGEAVRPVLLHRRGGVSGWAATGTVAAERILDGLVLSCLLFAGLELSEPLDPLPDRIGELPVSPAVVPAAAYGALALFAVAFGVMALFYWRRRWARAATHRVVGIVSPRLAEWVASRVATVAEGFGFLPRPRALAPFVLCTLAYWLLNAASAWLLAWGCGFEGISFSVAMVVVGVIALGILAPSAPGFFGAFQMAAYAGFALYFPVRDVVSAGAAFVCFLYAAQVGITVAFAVASAWLGSTSLADGLAEDPDPDQPEDRSDNLSSEPAAR
jgi:glycosyltransferase 2 family protein